MNNNYTQVFIQVAALLTPNDLRQLADALEAVEAAAFVRSRSEDMKPLTDRFEQTARDACGNINAYNWAMACRYLEAGAQQ